MLLYNQSHMLQHKCIIIFLCLLAPSLCFPYLPKLVFSLGTAQEWKHEHNRFHYPTLYNFIINFFENVEDEAAQKNADNVLNWWNQYVLSEIWKG